MDIKEAERVIAKPVASRPTCSTYRSFSELLAGATNASPSIESSHTTVSVIRPKTVRFKPAMNRPPAGFVSSQADIFGAPISDSSDKSSKPDTKQSLIYKPMAKLVSKATVSLLANIGNYSTSQQQPLQSMKANLQHLNHEKLGTNMSSNLHQSIAPHAEKNQTTPCKMVQQNQEEDLKTLSSTTNGDRPSYDGYNWRKYGQKQVKGSEYPRSYYKCTYPNCPVKKKVERSFDGQIAEIVYKGEHNHSKSQPPKCNSGGTQRSGMVSDGLVQDIWRNDSALIGAINAGGGSTENSCGLSGECEERSKGFEAEEDVPRSKRRKNENQSNEAAVSEEGLMEPRIVVQSSTDSEILGDGFRWRKYGQKVVKGNPYPRSYYRCTNIKCKVRKHVERAIDDPKAFLTTYEGKHNHEMPLKNTASVASDQDSQASLTPINGDRPSYDGYNWRKYGQKQVKGSEYPRSYYKCTYPNCPVKRSKGFEAEEDVPRSKRRKNENQSNEAAVSEEGLMEPRIVVQSSTDSEILGDGFRWRKYGQKVVKGNPYPRSYYRCTNIKCKVRKHVERAIDDPKAFVTTYEGKHNHEMPLKNTASVASDQDPQASLSKNKP